MATRSAIAGLSGDLFAYAGRWDDAIGAFHDIDSGDPESTLKAAVLLWFKGDLDAAYDEALKEGRALASRQFILGNVEAARGRLRAAAGLYEESARRYKSQMFRYHQLLKAGEIWLELGAPAEILTATGRRESPWLPGLRATAYLFQGARPSAEAEFSALRASLSPIVGEHVAAKTEQFHPLLGAFYGARYAEVVETAAGLPASFHHLTALSLARSLIALGRLDEARRHLEFLVRSRLSIGAPEIYEQLAALRIGLAEYYLGEIAANQGRLAEAREHYRRFVSAVPPGESSLPHFGKARTVLREAR